MESLTDGIAPAPRKNLPLRVLRAIDDALHLQGLPRCLRATFAELCRYVSQSSPLETIFAHKDKIAARIGASERTLYRHLAQLQDHGLIEVLPQERRSRNGRFAVARIRLTEKAAELVGLIAPKNPVVHSVPDDKVADGQSLTEPTNSMSHQPGSTENGLPMELTWLTGNGLSRSGIFALMGKATAKGKRLSDIVIVVREYIRDIKGGRLYGYLAKLASGPTCFAVAAAHERKRLADAMKARAFERKCAVFRERFRNAVLTNREQTKLYCIDERARFAQIIDGAVSRSAPLTDLTEWIERIEDGRLVLATLATERRLAGQN